MLEPFLAGLKFAMGTVEVTPGCIMNWTAEGAHMEDNAMMELGAVSTHEKYNTATGGMKKRQMDA